MNFEDPPRSDEEDNLRRIASGGGQHSGKIQSVLESAWFQRLVIILIAVNAVTLGLETSDWVMSRIGPALLLFDGLVLSFFVVELAAKLYVYRTRFHHDPWNVFDLIVVTIALLPASGGLAVLRSLRILRALRLVSAVPSMRRVVAALLAAIPGIGSIMGLLALVFYVFSVMATKLFGDSFPEWFGSITASAYSLFQIMTLESWSMGIVRPVMEIHPYSWLFFIPFILITSFTVLNLFIGIVVDAMHRQHELEGNTRQDTIAEESRSDRAEIIAELRLLREEVQALKSGENSPAP
jgi:voltage-gated sodium channel